jgi:putative tryptophan/tyrosine transport system substrate-binding protein
MRRRQFISLLGGAAATWPMATRAQQAGERMRRIGVLVNFPETDAEVVARLAAFRKALQDLGWAASGANLRIDVRFGVDDDDMHKKAKELVDLAPDVVLAMSPPSVMALLKVTRAVPIVFAAVTDPVGLGIVQSLARPGGNATGFLSAEFGFGAKWLELLKEIAPDIRKVVVLTDPDNRGAAPQFAAIQAVAPSFRVELSLLRSNDSGWIERGINDFARSGNGGLIALRVAEVIAHRELIINMAALHRLPAVYPLRIFAADGGLISYGPDIVDQFRQAASYVDRILKGDKPAELAVQLPTRYELVINLKTAKALGLTVPEALLATADEVIQ